MSTVDDRSPVRSVARAIDVLMALTDGPQSLGSVTEATGLSKATGHRLLAGLAYRHLVIQDSASGHYALGPGCLRLVEAVSRGLSGLGLLARPTLDGLWRESAETVTVHVRVGAQRICVSERPSQHPLRYTAGVGSVTPIHVGSAGKVLLAFLSNDRRAQLLGSAGLNRITEHTVIERTALERELAYVRRVGWATSRGERVIGAAALSAPVFDDRGEVVAALSILGPSERLTEARLRQLKPALLQAAAEITRVLGPPENEEDVLEVGR